MTYADGANVGQPLASDLLLYLKMAQCHRSEQVYELRASDVIIGGRVELSFVAQERFDGKDQNEYGSWDICVTTFSV